MEHVSLLSQLPWINHGFANKHESPLLTNPILMNQVHSADVLVIRQFVQTPSVDALVTKTPGLRLAVKSADCAPVLLADTQAKIVAAVHAGWRGAFQGVIENAILAMMKLGGRPENIVAGIGPHLQKDSFEFQNDMYALFPSTERRFFGVKNRDLYFDFHAYVEHRLRRAGVAQIDAVMIDTYADRAYNSYRLNPNNPARQISFIEIKGE
ncbi:MAG: polyphenol oxidase family protein [Alphaproteobacteria bacterium]|nr:polyphenol oxidase family protein [Alphaproteobacteria bacterium]